MLLNSNKTYFLTFSVGNNVNGPLPSEIGLLLNLQRLDLGKRQSRSR